MALPLGFGIVGPLSEKAKEMGVDVPDPGVDVKGNNTTDKTDNVYMPAPYNVVVEPTNAGHNNTPSGANYEKTYQKFLELKTKYSDQTDEAAAIRKSWSIAPSVTIDSKGNISLNGSDSFLKSDEAKQLRDTLKQMEGNTYNTEDLNKQIEAWNTTLAKMSEEYMNTVQVMNQANYALSQTATNAEHHIFTFQDILKIGNSAAVGKKPDAKTSKDKIFVGFTWDNDGNLVEKWVEAKDFYNEFDQEKDKRRAYRDLRIQANNGDVAAYSKLMYLQGGSDAGPANVSLDAGGDLINLFYEETLAPLASAVQGFFDYAPFFNIGTITSNLANYAEYSDKRDFVDFLATFIAPGLYADRYDSRAQISKGIADGVREYNELVDWEYAYISELNPESAKLVKGAGNVFGTALGVAYNLWGFGVGGEMKNTAIQAANNYLRSTGHFVSITSTATRTKIRVTNEGVDLANSGGILARSTTLTPQIVAAAQGEVLIPAWLFRISPKLSEYIAKAGEFAANMKMFRNGGGDVYAGGGVVDRTTSTLRADKAAPIIEESGERFILRNVGGRASAGQPLSQAAGLTSPANTGMSATLNSVKFGAEIPIKSNSGWISALAKGFQTGMNLAPLAGFSVLKNTEEYLVRAENGEDVGTLSDYLIKNCVKDIIYGTALGTAGAKIKTMREAAKAAKMPVNEIPIGDYTTSQGTWYGPTSQYTGGMSGRNSLTPGNEYMTNVSDIEKSLSTIMTVNNEALVGFPVDGNVSASAVPGTYVKDQSHVLGAVANNRITKYNIEQSGGKTFLVKEITNILDDTKVTTRKEMESYEAALKEANISAVPKTTPKTIENSDSLNGIKVAPLTINGVTPNVMPNGVSQVKVELGLVYRTPDDLVDDIAEIAENSGWHEDNIDRIYNDYERFVHEAQAQEENFAHMTEAPDILNPRDGLYGVDIDGLLRLAAWSKVNGYNLIPVKTAAKTARYYKKFSMQDKFISKLADKYQLPELNAASLMVNSRGEENKNYYGTNQNGSLFYALPNIVPAINKRGTEYNSLDDEHKKAVDIIGALSLIFSGDITGHWDLLSGFGENRRAAIHNQGVYATLTNIRRAKDLAALSGMSKENLAKAAQAYIHKFEVELRDANDGELSEKNSDELYNAFTTLTDAINDGHAWFSGLAEGPESVEKKIEDYFNGVYNSDDALTEAAKTGTPLSSDIVVPISKVGDNLIYKESEVKSDTLPTMYAHIPAGTKVAKRYSLTPEGNPIRTMQGGYYYDWAFDDSAGFTRKEHSASSRNDDIYAEIEKLYGYDLKNAPFSVDDISLSIKPMLDKTPNAVGSKSLMEYHFADGDGYQAQVVLMRPADYLDFLKRAGNMNEDVYEDIRDDSDTAKYTKDMANGDKFPMPALKFDQQGNFDGQEGRHRAFAAKNNHINLIPVAIKYPASENWFGRFAEQVGLPMVRMKLITPYVSDIVTNNNPKSKIVDLYYNHPNGAAYTPVQGGYNLADYGVYDRNSVVGMQKAARELLEPNKEVVEKNKEQIKEKVTSLYTVTEPGGVVNRLNNRIRKQVAQGTLPKDSVSTRVGAAIDLLDSALETGDDGYGGWDDTPEPLLPETIDEISAGLESILLDAATDLNDARGHRVDSPNVVIDGSPLYDALSEIVNKVRIGRLVQGISRTADEEGISDERVEQVIGNLHKEHGKKYVDEAVEIVNTIDEGGKVDPIVSYIQDVINIRQKLDDYAPNTGQLNIDADRAFLDRLKGELVDLVIKYNESLPTGFSKYMKPLSDGWGDKGSHNVKVDMMWDIRGISEYGNSVNAGDGIRTRVQDLQVGQHVFWPSLDYGTFNLEVPNAYAAGDGYGGGHRYFVLTGSPKGTGLFFYGDPKNFGAHEADEHIHTNDGGALVHPMNMGATIVAIRELAPDATLIIQIRDNADGTPYSGPIDGQGGGVTKITERVKEDYSVETPNNFLVTEYGVPSAYFPDADSALEYASQFGNRAVHEITDEAEPLDRPPVDTDEASEPLLLEAGGSPEAYVRKFDGLMVTMPTLADSPIDYSRGVVDIARTVRAIYNEVSANVNLDSIYQRYAQSIAENTEPQITPDEKRALEPLTHTLDILGHYFDPSGKSLTQEFYLPTGLPPKAKVSIEKAILGEDGVIDEENPLAGGADELLLDPLRIGDSGFWQKRSGDLFRDEEGNFTMARAGTLEDNLIAYTVSALTRGPHKLTFAVNNEVLRSKLSRNRTQITAKQALAGLKQVDTINTKTKVFQAKTYKDAEKLAELKENYSGDESTIDKAAKAKNYSKELNYTQGLNHSAQLLGYNQFLEMTPIQGSPIRFGTQSGRYKGFTNIRRKLSRINITGTIWLRRNGSWDNYGIGLQASEANMKKYGLFKETGPEPTPINLGEIMRAGFESQQYGLAFFSDISKLVYDYRVGRNGDDLKTVIEDYANDTFPLLEDTYRATTDLLHEIGKAATQYPAAIQSQAYANAVNDAIAKWIRYNTMACLNNAIKMSDISNLDDRTLEALDDAASYMLVNTPLKTSTFINALIEWDVLAKLALNANLMIGNIGSEIFTRLPGYIGWNDTGRALKRGLAGPDARRIDKIIANLPNRFETEDGDIAKKAHNFFKTAKDKIEGVSLVMLNWSEKVKNRVYYAAGEINAERKGITDPIAKEKEALKFVAEHAIAGGKGTTPGIGESNLGRVFFIFRNFTIRNFDDFVEFVEKASRGESGDNYWDEKYDKKHKGEKTKAGKNRPDILMAARMIGGRAFRAYIFWLLVGSYFGKTFLDALGGDPTGILDVGQDRGLYDDPDTDENEGMTDLDNFINNIPAGSILGTLQDIYFAMRRRGIDAKQFIALDFWNDPKFGKSLNSKIPGGVAKNRFADMIDLIDHGYSFSSTGRKTYAAPETNWDLVKGFLFGKSTTANSLAYGKYRYGMVNVWGDLSSGDWMDFAMSAIPGGKAEFDTTRKDYTGVFNGSWNDMSTMQLIIQQFRQRQQKIIDDFQRDKYRYTGEYEGLTDDEKLAKAKEQREKKINEFTNDVTRAVDAFTEAGNALSDSQITTMMYLFDFHEGEEDDEWNSTYARRRYVEAGLPDYNATGIKRVEKEDGNTKKEETQNILDRSLIIKNAEQGFYGSSKEAANAIKDALKDFKSTYKEYNTRVKALNDKYFEARNKNKNSAETKQLSNDLEALQNEYLEKLFKKIEPVIDKYGTALVGTYDGADALAEYMGNMIPYSSIKRYGQTYSSGNDIVYGQLSEWLQKRLGRNAPTAPSDKEVTSGIEEIKSLLDSGKTAAAKSRARAILERIGRGSLGARRDDVETLRSFLND